MSTKLTPLLLASIISDPIVVFYMKMTNSTQSLNDNQLPTFSDTSLRLALSEAYGHRTIQGLRFEESTVQLYRRLLLYHYSDKYKSATELQSIMSCMEAADIEKAFNSVDDTIMVWHKFLKYNLIHIFFKEAFLEIMLEWGKRYYYLNGELKPELYSESAVCVLEFLLWDCKYLRNWMPAFKKALSKANLTQTNASYATLTPDDLVYRKITRDIQNRLSPLVHKFVLNSLQLNDDNPPRLSVTKRANAPTESPAKTKNPKIEVQNIEIVNSIDIAALIKEQLKPNTGCISKTTKEQTATKAVKIVKLNDATPIIKAQVKTNPNLISKTTNKSTEAKVLGTEHLKMECISKATKTAGKLLNAPAIKVPATQFQQRLKSQSKEELDVLVIDSDSDDNVDNTRTLDEVSDTVIEVNQDSVVLPLAKRAKSDSEDESPKGGTISRDKAICYISRLQGYALHHGYLDALRLLDEVDTVVRKGKM